MEEIPINIKEFSEALLSEIKTGTIDSAYKKEDAFEQGFLTPIAWRLATQNSDICLCIHPNMSKDKCTPTCKAAHAGDGEVQQGCPTCWKDSKEWAAVNAYGFHNCFDLVAMDRDNHTLAIEAKLLKAKGGKMPNGEFQRFFGQCLLAAARHDVVIGVCGHIGPLNPKHNAQTYVVRKLHERLGIQVVFREVPAE